MIAKSFKKIVAQMILNCPLLPNGQNNLARKWPMIQKILATPLSSIDRKIAELFLFRKEAQEQPKTPTRTKLDGTFIKLWVMCVYRIKHRRTALHIENSSQYANEGEILIMPYTVFKVKNIGHIQPSFTNQTMTEIEFEECDQFFNPQIQDT